MRLNIHQIIISVYILYWCMADQVRVRVIVSKEQGKLEEPYTAILTSLLKAN